MDMERYGRVYIDNGLQPNPFMENHTARGLVAGVALGSGKD